MSASTAPRTSVLWLLPFLAATTAVAVIGAVSASRVPQEYAALDQPGFAPPSWVFGPVWTVLYVMIGVAGWLLWRPAGRSSLLTLWGVQLVLNLLWTPLFFGLGLRGLALVDIVLLDAAVLVLVVLGWRRLAHRLPAAAPLPRLGPLRHRPQRLDLVAQLAPTAARTPRTRRLASGWSARTNAAGRPGSASTCSTPSP